MAKKIDKYFTDQFDDEEVLYVFRKHHLVMRRGLIYSSLAMLAGPLYTLFILNMQPERAISFSFFIISIVLSLVLAIIVFMPSWIAWYYSVFIVTDQRFIQMTQKGLFHRSVVDIGLNQIQMVNYEISGFQETLFGFGTIMMQTYMGDLVIHYVHRPAKTQKKMLHILRDQGVILTTHPVQKLASNEEAIEEA